MFTDNHSPAVPGFALLALAGILLFGTTGCHPWHGHYHGGPSRYAVLVPATPVPHLAIRGHKEPPRHVVKAPAPNRPAVHAPQAGKGNQPGHAVKPKSPAPHRAVQGHKEPPRHVVKAPAKNTPVSQRTGHAVLADKGNAPR